MHGKERERSRKDEKLGEMRKDRETPKGAKFKKKKKSGANQQNYIGIITMGGKWPFTGPRRRRRS